MEQWWSRWKVLLAVSWFLLGTIPAEAATGNYQVFAFNDLGMHCIDADFSTLVILPPYNVLHAQVLQKGAKPVLLDGAQARLTYNALTDRKGSSNSTSKGKTNFWQYAQALFGVKLPVDVGLKGAKMPNAHFGPQPLTYDNSTGNNWFTALGVPITDRDNQGRINPFPLMRVKASVNGAKVDYVDAVLPISSEQHCEVCHATGMDAASPGFYGVNDWSKRKNLVLQFKENILILHDALNGTKLWDSRPVLCANCHYSPALGIVTPEQAGHALLSPAMHKHHGTMPAPPAVQVLPIPDDGANTCYFCHPGSKTKCLRGAMATAGIVCQDCHGGLLAVAGVNQLQVDPPRNRVPWQDEPKCQSCHTGDAANGMAGGLPVRIAYDPNDPAATPQLAPGSRFAEPPDTLFRFSSHHGMACEACHGSTHCEWPTSDPKGNDNVAAKEIQGHPGPIIECAACHTAGLATSLNGPHGLHNVNDATWVAGDTSHKTFFDSANPANCQACHGLDLTGTRLSRVASDRQFTSQMGNTVLLKQGTTVSCSQCHQNPLTKY
jgi:hypothetical protein